jgi:hypothetical protein
MYFGTSEMNAGQHSSPSVAPNLAFKQQHPNDSTPNVVFNIPNPVLHYNKRSEAIHQWKSSIHV